MCCFGHFSQSEFNKRLQGALILTVLLASRGSRKSGESELAMSRFLQDHRRNINQLMCTFEKLERQMSAIIHFRFVINVSTSSVITECRTSTLPLTSYTTCNIRTTKNGKFHPQVRPQNTETQRGFTKGHTLLSDCDTCDNSVLFYGIHPLRSHICFL